MLKFLKMTVAEDVTTMEEVQTEVSAAREKVSVAKEKALAAADLKAKEAADSVQDLPKEAPVNLAEEAKQEVPRHHAVKADFPLTEQQEERMLQERKDFQKEHQDAQKAPLKRQKQNDQEKANIFC